MTWVAVGVGIAGVAGSMMASKKQAQGGENALRLQGDIYNANKGELDPYRNFGVQNMTALQQGLGIGDWDGGRGYTATGFNPNAPLTRQFTLADFHQSPAYQWNLQQGTDALNKSAAARGNYYAPETLKNLSNYTQGAASNEYWNAANQFRNWQNDTYGKLAGGVGTGLSAANALAGVGTNMAGMMGHTAQGIGDAQAGGIMGAFNSLAGGAVNGYNNYQQNQMMNQQQSIFGGGGGDFAP
jgi:hypothetical protein